MQPRDFYVKQEAEEGRRVDLSNADGAPSEHWLVVRSVLSQQYEKAFDSIKAQALVQVVELSKAGGKEQALRMDKQQRRARKARLVASLISDWSLDLPCNETEKTNLLIQAPRLRRQIERISETIFIARAGHV
ncbi:hypothetical protein AABC73_14815 [Pseudomonas sp. G.S.17]|uniref:hypothetical protein n=1 Tax=Pseudomonas sp. G.S.17 TaxID=3137451 RepID=UPI00311CA710